MTMFTKRQVDSVSKKMLKTNENFNGFQIMRLKDYLKLFSEEINENMALKTRPKNTPYEILCLVDLNTDVNHTMSPERKRKLRKSGGARRRKVKEKYHYDNVFNRIHGYVILEDQQKNKNIPRSRIVLSLSLICSSSYSNKKGVGSLLMKTMIELAKKCEYTDIILEIANEYTGLEYDSDEEEEEYDNSDEEEEYIESESVNDELITLITKEFVRKNLRLNDGVAYYNICEGYIEDIIYSYLEDEYDIEDNSNNFVEFNKEEPGEHDYGGYWYNKGKRSTMQLFNFYEKFGFVEDGRVNYEWKSFTTDPAPSMILTL